MSSAQVISFDYHRVCRNIEKRLSQNALILNAAIKDPRLSREDLKLLVSLLNFRPVTGVMAIPYTPDDRFVVRSFRKLQQAGYLGAEQVKYRPNLPGQPTQWWFDLTDRELARTWL